MKGIIASSSSKVKSYVAAIMMMSLYFSKATFPYVTTISHLHLFLYVSLICRATLTWGCEKPAQSVRIPLLSADAQQWAADWVSMRGGEVSNPLTHTQSRHHRTCTLPDKPILYENAPSVYVGFDLQSLFQSQGLFRDHKDATLLLFFFA